LFAEVVGGLVVVLGYGCGEGLAQGLNCFGGMAGFLECFG
jgi:hypothetical protein